MQELQNDFGFYPMGNTRLNSTIIDDDENFVPQQDCPMKDDDDDDDDGVEISQNHSVSLINEKCLLDELLQTEEVRKRKSCISVKCHI